METHPGLIQELGQFSTPAVLNGLKWLGLGPRELKTADRSAISCMSPGLPPVCGFAATEKIESRRGGDKSGVGTSAGGRRGLYDHIASKPSPRILVVENVGAPDGPACFLGEVMANVYAAQGVVAAVTNGPVRDLPEMEALGFQTFADGLDVGGGWFQAVEIGRTVTIGGLVIEPGDLLHGDMHGLLKIPLEMVPALPDAVRAVERYERGVIETASGTFDVEKLLEAFAAKH